VKYTTIVLYSWPIHTATDTLSLFLDQNKYKYLIHPQALDKTLTHISVITVPFIDLRS